MMESVNLNNASRQPVVAINPQSVRIFMTDNVQPLNSVRTAKSIARLIATEIARLGCWDGQEIIRIPDPFGIHQRLNRWVTITRRGNELIVRQANHVR